MRSWLVVVPALAATVLLGACGGGDDGGSLSIDRLEDADQTCPVDLDAAAAAAGLGEAGADVEVEVERGTGDGGRDAAAAIDQVGGVYVECTRPAEGGEVAGYLFASELPDAISVLLPLIAADLELAVDDLDGILERYNAADEGDFVDLGSDGPAAAARIHVDGADSAVLYVSAADGGASPAQVRSVAENLLDDL